MYHDIFLLMAGKRSSVSVLSSMAHQLHGQGPIQRMIWHRERDKELQEWQKKGVKEKCLLHANNSGPSREPHAAPFSSCEQQLLP
ncbi:MAG TPA: hypothetical protein DD706_11555 [Nitrospiraceae bacterium]|nr:hypothetical protein [Nitrospiraceae bacterium]